MNAAIAQHLNILESAIVRVEEWSKVLFVVAKGIGARFVSKKVKQVELKGSEKQVKWATDIIAKFDEYSSDEFFNKLVTTKVSKVSASTGKFFATDNMLKTAEEHYGKETADSLKTFSDHPEVFKQAQEYYGPDFEEFQQAVKALKSHPQAENAKFWIDNFARQFSGSQNMSYDEIFSRCCYSLVESGLIEDLVK